MELLTEEFRLWRLARLGLGVDASGIRPVKPDDDSGKLFDI
jgi:hypothetical protein